jgi:hypothetical protein
MKSSNIIYGGIGFVALSIASYFAYKKFGEDEDDKALNKSIKEAQNAYGYTPTQMSDGGGKKTTHRKYKKRKNTRRK